MTELIDDAGALADMGEQLNAVLVPHRQLCLSAAMQRTAFGGVPRPNRIEQLQLSFEFAAVTERRCADEVSIDVVWMRLVLGE